MVSFDKLKSDLQKLEESEELKKYLETHKGAYFVSAFMISSYDELEKTPWVFEYYWPENGKVATFSFNDGWTVTSDDKVLQEKKASLEKLDLDTVKFVDGRGKVKLSLENEHKEESILKVIVILNSHDKVPAWNITVFTKSFKVINFKVDAVNGEVKSSKIDNLINFKKS